MIAKAGKPMVKVVPIEEPVQSGKRRLGFMEGEMTIPDDFDTFAQDEIEKLFYGEE